MKIFQMHIIIGWGGYWERRGGARPEWGQSKEAKEIKGIEEEQGRTGGAGRERDKVGGSA